MQIGGDIWWYGIWKWVAGCLHVGEDNEGVHVHGSHPTSKMRRSGKQSK